MTLSRVAVDDAFARWRQSVRQGWQKIRALETTSSLIRVLYSRKAWLRLALLYAAALGTAFSVILYLYTMNPELIVKAFISWSRRKSGIKTKFISDSTGFRFCYAERGRKRSGVPTIVLVPGLGGTVDNWVPVIKHMTSRCHVIAVELPGFGMTSCDPSRDLNIMGQLNRLQEFILLMQLDKSDVGIHLVGAATGGTIVGCLAAIHPRLISKLSLVCPAMRSSENSEVVRMELAGIDSGLLFKTPDDLQRTLEILSNNAKKVPKQIRKGIFELRRSQMHNVRKLAESMLDDIWKGDSDTLLVPRIVQIQAPTQVVWGKFDRVDHVSGAAMLKERLRHCVGVHIIETSGHSIYMDAPRELATLIEQFNMTSQ